jgi:Zn-dependent peptidase ImmA (M78 family)
MKYTKLSSLFKTTFDDMSSEKVHRDRLDLQNLYAHVTRFLSHPEVDISVQIDPYELLGGKTLDDEFREQEIEAIARRLQNTLWEGREDIWKTKPKHPVDVLDPTIGLESVGYLCEQVPSLGRFSASGDRFKIAAVIDDQELHVKVSEENRPDTVRFTTAHELGHAILHKCDGLHRDRPIGEARSRPMKDRREREADKFASYFLMPAKQLVKAFRRRFGGRALTLTEDVAFALGPESGGDIDPTSSSRREFARALADTHQFEQNHFHSLAEKFGVSVEAMAIRLEVLPKN